MKIEEYKEFREQEIASHLSRMRELDMDFAKSNCKVKLNDVVTDDTGLSIRVEKFLLHRGDGRNNFPYFSYRGITLKKDGTPRKNMAICIVDGHRVKSINGKEVSNEEV